MTPSIEAAKKLAGFLNTSVGYLLGETEDDDLLKDPKMIRRLKELNGFSEEEKDQGKPPTNYTPIIPDDFCKAEAALDSEGRVRIAC
jgi:hypothetical protein